MEVCFGMILSFCKRIVDSSNDVFLGGPFFGSVHFLVIHWITFFVRNVPMALAALAADGVRFGLRGKYACKSQDQERDRTDRIRQS